MNIIDKDNKYTKGNPWSMNSVNISHAPFLTLMGLDNVMQGKHERVRVKTKKRKSVVIFH